MEELNKLENAQGLETHLCRKCAYCIVFEATRECEWDNFSPVDEEKSYRYTAIEFDCIHFIAR